jgi:predicted DNA-binding transcriptional regulator YafY
MIPRPTTRLLTLLELLQSHDLLGGEAIARRLEIDTRSVRRYIAMLQDIGIPVEAVRGPHGGYRLRPGFKLPPLMLTTDEALALGLAVMEIPHAGLVLAPGVIAGLQAKLERVLPAPLRAQVQAMTAGIALAPAAPVRAAEGSLIALFGRAAREGQQVQVRYRADSGEESIRVVDPYGVARWSRAWYLAGYCHLRVGLRVFRLDRIAEATPLDTTFTLPDAFDTYGYVTQTMERYPGRWTVVVRLDLPIDEARRVIPAGYGSVRPLDGGTLFEGRFNQVDWLARWLVSLGCTFTVHEPEELREDLRRLAREIAMMAERETIAIAAESPSNQSFSRSDPVV